jgi:hypothetical protein
MCNYNVLIVNINQSYPVTLVVFLLIFFLGSQMWENHSNFKFVCDTVTILTGFKHVCRIIHSYVKGIFVIFWKA